MFVSFVRAKMFFALVILGLVTGCSTAGASSATATVAPIAQSSSSSAVAAATTTIPASSSASASSSAIAVPSASGDTIKLVAVPGKSQAGYRVREQLANVAFPTDAVGTTNSITGTIVGKTDGTLVSSDSKFVVDLSTLKSDQEQRDNFIRRSTLQTNQYPTATFVPTSASGLPTTVPSSGSVAFTLTGNLTIRDVTKPVTWDVTCQPQSATEGTCNATTTFKFEDFGMTVPRVFTVLSIVDSIKLEVTVDLQKG